MTRRRFAGFSCLALLLSQVGAQEPPKPGKEHEKMKELVGEWDATLSFAGQEMKGSSVWKMELNGFFLTQEFKSDFGGMAFQGRGTTSYCPVRKKYISTWIDNVSPSMTVMYGHYANDNTMIEEGESPNMEGKLVKVKSKSVMKDKNTLEFTMYEVDASGKENQTMTIVYKRKT